MSNQTGIHRFAAIHSLTVRRDKGDGSPIIPGKAGHIFEYDNFLLGVLVEAAAVRQDQSRQDEVPGDEQSQ